MDYTIVIQPTLIKIGASLVAQAIKSLPAVWETRV